MPEKQNAVVAVYGTHTDAEEAVKELQRSAFNLKQLSIVGKDYQTEEQVVGFPTAMHSRCVLRFAVELPRERLG